MRPVGIVGGSGFYELLENPRVFVHNNKYGRSSGISEGMIQGRKVHSLSRHGEEHEIIVPHINYRASIWVSKGLGVEQILATSYVGSSNPDIELGSLVIPHDFCDWTRRFLRSLYDDEVEAYHVNVIPTCYPNLRKASIQATNQIKPGHVRDQAVIFVNEELRSETPLEPEVLRKLRVDPIGTTTLSGTVFAREVVICCAHICIPTNWCLREQIEADDPLRLLRQRIEDSKQVLYLVIPALSDDKDCPCSHALSHAILKK